MFNRKLDKVTIGGVEYSLHGKSDRDMIGECQYVVAVSPNGDDGEINTQVYIEAADAEYNNGDEETTMYRFVENDDAGDHEKGGWTLSRDEAVKLGHKFIAENQESL